MRGMKRKRNPWVAIMAAGAKGMGLHLSAYEVGLLACDCAIEQCAFNDIEAAGDEMTTGGWEKADPTKYPVNPSIPKS